MSAMSTTPDIDNGEPSDICDRQVENEERRFFQQSEATVESVSGSNFKQTQRKRGKYLCRSASTDSYQHQLRKHVLEAELFNMSLSSTAESTDETGLMSAQSITNLSIDDNSLDVCSCTRVKEKRKLFGSNLFRRNFASMKTDDQICKKPTESDIAQQRSRYGLRMPRFLFARKPTYDKLDTCESMVSLSNDASTCGGWPQKSVKVGRPPLKKSFSMSEAYEEEVIDVDEDQMLAKFYSPFCPRRMAICRQMNIPEMKQLETYLVITRLKQFCFI